MPSLDCIAEGDLRAFLLGELPERVATVVTTHLESCPDCEAAARRLDGLTDPVIDRLRHEFQPAVEMGLKSTVAECPPAPLERGAAVIPGRHVEGYEILEEVGRGGSSVVYRARQARPARVVALKVLLAGGHSDAERRARFLAEADAFARLRHPNIVQIHQVGIHDGLPFLALEYVDGGNLAQKLNGTPLPPRAAADLLAQLAEAVEFAHRSGVVHRDLKPSNVLLAKDGTPKITDFGLAKQEQSELTATGAVLGTPSYMAPEQAAGQARGVGPAADVYALGCILYELLTGRTPFRGATPLETLDQVRTQEPVPPGRLQGKLPRDLETICLKCLRKEPLARYASAEALAQDLRRFLRGEPVRARRVGVPELAWRWCARNAALAFACAAAALLTVALAVGMTLAAWTFRRQRDGLRFEQGRTAANLARAEAAEDGLRVQLGRTQEAERQARFELGNSLLAQGIVLQRTAQVGQRFTSLEKFNQAARELRNDPRGRGRLDEIRDHAIAAMGLTDVRIGTRSTFNPGGSIRCDRNLERFASVEGTAVREVVVRSLHEGRELVRLPCPTGGNAQVVSEFSPIGQYLRTTYGDDDQGSLTEVWHLGRRERVFRHATFGFGQHFHPDSRRFVFTSADRNIVVWDLIERREVRRLPVDFSPVDAAVDPAGRRLAANAFDGALRIFDLETGAVLTSPRGEVGDFVMSWSFDGRLLAVGHRDGRIFVWDVDHGRLASVLRGHTNRVLVCQFSPDSYLLTTESWDSTTRFWDAAAGEQILSMPAANGLGFSTDGRRAVSGVLPDLSFWEVAHGQPVRTINADLTGNQIQPSFAWWLPAAFSPDGRLLALAAFDGVHLYDGYGRRNLGRLRSGNCVAILFEPGGGALLTAGERGLFRWPIRRTAAEQGPDALRIGPPSLVRDTTPGRERYPVCWDPHRNTVALVDNAEARLLLLGASGPRRAWARAVTLPVPHGQDVTAVAISPDGRWAAAGGWKRSVVDVWDLIGRRVERHLPVPVGASTVVAISPDGRWLVAGTHFDTIDSAFHFWEVGTWKPGPTVAKSVASGWHAPVFSPDGRLVALAVSPRQIRLFDPARNRTIAHLSTLEPVSPAPVAFSPDGTRLVASTNQRRHILWDLPAIRAQLRTMDLDWDWPPASTGEALVESLHPLRAIVVDGEALEPSAWRAAERTALDTRLLADPSDAEAWLDRGWLRLRAWDMRGALADLEHGVRLRPEDDEALYLLAGAYLSAGEPAAAISTLDAYLRRRADDLEAREMRGFAALDLGRFADAVADFTTVLAKDAGRRRAREGRVQAHVGLKQRPQAIEDLQWMERVGPQDRGLVDLHNWATDRLGRRHSAAADFTGTAERLPQDALGLNNLAEKLLTGPAGLRDPGWALTLARKAVEKDPANARYINTLGVALCRCGRFAEAIRVLERSLALGGGQTDGFDLLFLAIARHALGQVDRARADVDRALSWIQSRHVSAEWLRELKMFHAEAMRMLYELPDDVFAH
jgi:WD40 repeat protein/tetratricopeptide (TPR) repeat protein/tRNA A-37 threonylcarbamoyl transferase component Bud32